MRLLWLALALAVALLLPFIFFGEKFTSLFTGDAAVQWLRGCGTWAWAAVIGLLMADLVLPLPATGLMAAAGYIYGAWLGGAISAGGSFLSGVLAYSLCRRFGRGLALRFTGEHDLAEGDKLFRRSGPWLVALSRWLPLLPEVIACLAGLTRMPLKIFLLALACGSVPMGFAYAAIGAAGQENPRLAIALSIAVPPVLWAVVRWCLSVRSER